MRSRGNVTLMRMMLRKELAMKDRMDFSGRPALLSSNRYQLYWRLGQGLKREVEDQMIWAQIILQLMDANIVTRMVRPWTGLARARELKLTRSSKIAGIL